MRIAANDAPEHRRRRAKDRRGDDHDEQDHGQGFNIGRPSGHQPARSDEAGIRHCGDRGADVGCEGRLPGGRLRANRAGPEVKGTKLGYIALTDASPLIIAKEKGFYAKHGLPDMEV